MQSNDQLSAILNDLIEVNNDRVRGYEKAVDETAIVDIDLHAIFNSMANDSRRYTADLTHEVIILGGECATATTHLGKTHREWMDGTKSSIKNDRQTILESCDSEEHNAQKAYTDALSFDIKIDSKIRDILNNQQASLKMAHNLIKKYRDL